MKIALGLTVVLFVLIGSLSCDKSDSFNDDNDFAEFEDFDSDDDFIEVAAPSDKNDGNSKVNRAESAEGTAGNNQNEFQNADNDEDGLVEDEDSEFDHFADEEEFEGFNKGGESAPPVFDQKTGEPKLTVAKVPLHFG